MPDLTTIEAAALPIHPAANFLPPMSPEELAVLTADIHANGQRIPVALLNDQVVDGRHRIRACAAAGRNVRVAELPAGTDPFTYVFSTNVSRRSLSMSQRAMTAVRLMRSTGASAADAAARVGVSTAYVSMARNLLDNEPEVADRVWAGELSLGVAHRRLRRVQRPDLNHTARRATPAPVAAVPVEYVRPASDNPLLDALRWLQASGQHPAAWVATLPVTERRALVEMGDAFFRLAYDAVVEAG